MQTFADWISLPENRTAQAAAERVSRSRSRRSLNPLFLHGSTGTGKTHLASALVARVIERLPDRLTSLTTANDFETLVRGLADHQVDAADDLQTLREADLLVVEDVQHLSEQAAEAFVQLLDHCVARAQQVVVTANCGPAKLSRLPARLTSRLAAGLVVGLEPLSSESRLSFLKERARRRGLEVAEPVLEWLADNGTGSVRQLEGAFARLEGLARLSPNEIRAETLAEHFRADADANRATVERIVERVCNHFEVEPRKLQIQGRSPSAAVPRQVSMYLARRLTGLSLRQIGDYFGGRDHTTVMHACRKVEKCLKSDLQFCGTVRLLQADLT
jgi:chromosomal replication initiator protein